MKNSKNQWKSLLHGTWFTIGFPIVNINENGDGRKSKFANFGALIFPIGYLGGRGLWVRFLWTMRLLKTSDVSIHRENQKRNTVLKINRFIDFRKIQF